MAALSIKLDFTKFSQDLQHRVAKLHDKEYLLRPVATELIHMMTERIHQKGLASDGGQIGTYSSGYMRTREKYNRGKDTKVIIALTSQLENDWAVIATDKGYGIGFLNPHNFDKSQWVEATYQKKIFQLTEAESQYAKERFDELIKDALNS